MVRPFLRIAQTLERVVSAAPARRAATRLRTDVVGVDEWPRVLARRFRAAARSRSAPVAMAASDPNLDLELVPVACGQFFGLRIEWLTGGTGSCDWGYS